ncbi:Copia-like retroelement pol polyprotein [Abeliophyllum distichum]|uniref:Copia-like retroelement pol polyprotein n=1 Tax=Abeliophyllum distichum TaxID=126358 RepID=A0ABD1RFY2_9LAMI
MDSGKDLESNLSDFSKIVKSLAHNNKKYDDEDLAVILLNSLLDSYRDVRNAIKYARDVLTQSIVIDALRSNDLEVKKESRRNAREERHFKKDCYELKRKSKQQQNEDQNIAVVGDVLDGLHVMTVSDGEIDHE